MRVAAIYDIHGNLPALEAVLRDIRRARVARIVVGGDVFPGPMAREALDLLLGLDNGFAPASARSRSIIKSADTWVASR